MLEIRLAENNEYCLVRDFYYEVTDALENAQYSSGGMRDIYPTQEFLADSIKKKELYIGRVDGEIVACMVVNHDYNDGYNEIQWKTQAKDDEILVIHALGVHLGFSGQDTNCMNTLFNVEGENKDEEKVLEEGLAGYREYKKKVKYRMIPFIW